MFHPHPDGCLVGMECESRHRYVVLIQVNQQKAPYKRRIVLRQLCTAYSYSDETVEESCFSCLYINYYAAGLTFVFEFLNDHAIDSHWRFDDFILFHSFAWFTYQ